MPSILEIVGYVLMIAAYTADLIEKFGILKYSVVIITIAIIYKFRYGIFHFFDGNKNNKMITDFSTSGLIDLAFDKVKSSKLEDKILGLQHLAELYVFDYDKVFKGLLDVLTKEKRQDGRNLIRQYILHIYEKSKIKR